MRSVCAGSQTSLQITLSFGNNCLIKVFVITNTILFESYEEGFLWEAFMELAELLPTLRELDRHDKLRAMQFLVSELAKEENALLSAGDSYPVWSPYNSFEAGSVLLDALKEDHDAP
jgi:hypothetical protein